MLPDKIRGIIIKTLDYKEKDRLVYILTPHLGKISSIAKNVRTRTSRHSSILQPLNICDFVMFKGKSLYTINEVTVVDTFNELKVDYDLLTFAIYFLELADINQEDGMANEAYFFDLLKALNFLKIEGINVRLLTAAFEIKTLQRSGNYLDMEYIGAKVSGEVRGILKFLISSEIEKINVLKPSDRALKELSMVTSELIKNGFHRIPKSLSIIETTQI